MCAQLVPHPPRMETPRSPNLPTILSAHEHGLCQLHPEEPCHLLLQVLRGQDAQTADRCEAREHPEEETCKSPFSEPPEVHFSGEAAHTLFLPQAWVPSEHRPPTLLSLSHQESPCLSVR